MTHGSIIGYDINAKMCQISYYNEKINTQVVHFFIIFK